MLEAMALFLFHKGIQITNAKLIQLAYRVPPFHTTTFWEHIHPFTGLQIMNGWHLKCLFEGLVLKISTSHKHNVIKSTHVPRPFHG